MKIAYLILFFIIHINYLFSSEVYSYKSETNNIFKKNIKIKQTNNITRKLVEINEDIAIIHINDVHCAINNTIGYDGFVLYREELKKQYKYVITVDAGDFIEGGIVGLLSQGSAIVKIMNKIGFDVAVLGNHEFGYGVEQLFNLNNSLNTTIICSNFLYRKNRTLIFEPYKIMEIGNKKIGFIGIITPLTFSLTKLSTITDENGEILYDFLSENNYQELYDNTQKYINELKAKGVDYVILLTHIGKGGFQNFKSDFFLSKLEGVDAILDGHTHQIYNETSKDKNNNDIIISQTGSKLESIGVLLLKKDGTIQSEIIKEVPIPKDKEGAKNIIRNNKERWVNEEMYNYMNSIWDEYKDELYAQIGYSNYDIVSQDCCSKECNIGNFVSDAIKYAGKGDISLINCGGIRSSIKKGTISRINILEIFPWFNNIVIKELPGSAILDALEYGVSSLPKKSFLPFPQISGITFDVDTSFNSPVIIDENVMFSGISGKRRVSNVKINGVNLDVNKIYKAALIDYVANGGDGYSMLQKYEVTEETLITDCGSIELLIKDKYKGEIPKDYTENQGRINIDKKDDENNSSGNYLKSHFNNHILNLMILILFLL